MTRALEKTGRLPDKGHGEEILDFLVVFVDKCHHGKEEGLLFPALEAVGVSRNGGPIGVLLEEHRKGRSLTAEMTAAPAGLRKAAPGAARDSGFTDT
jgi:hemerythrin-like domain-containing protein